MIEIDFTANGGCSSLSGGHDNDWSVASRNTMLVGVGASGVPWATQPIRTYIKAVHKVDGSEYATTNASAKLTWAADGAFELSGTFDSPVDQVELGDLLGRHVLAFP